MRSLSLVLLLVACGPGTPESTTTPEPDPAPAEDPPTEPAMVVEGEFATPESVLYDEAGDRYLVSNINGSPFAEDGNGFVSVVDPEGAITNLRFIDGAAQGVTLNAPKGMAIAGNRLYVADITVVRVFELETGAPVGEVVFEGATFLNDMVADGLVLYVSDTGVGEGFEPSGTDAVYRFTLTDTPVAVGVAVGAGDELGRPNGLAVVGGALTVVTFGSGELFSLGEQGRSGIQALPQGSLDGLVALPDGSFLVSSWAASGIYRGHPGGDFTLIIRGVAAPADIGFDTRRQRVLVPLFNDDRVQIYSL